MLDVSAPETAEATIRVYDVQGRERATLFEGTLSPGVPAFLETLAAEGGEQLVRR